MHHNFLFFFSVVYQHIDSKQLVRVRRKEIQFFGFFFSFLPLYIYNILS